MKKLREWVRDQRIAVRIARKDVESGRRLGRYRWVVERTTAWLFGYRRLAVRHERKPNLFCALLPLAAALTCFKRLVKAAM